jgi:hypothetical protein
LDYIFKNELYLPGSYLFNEKGSSNANFADFSVLAADNVMSPQNLFLFKHTVFLSANFTISTIFSPDFSNIIVYPSLSYSLSENLDLRFAVPAFNTTRPLEKDKLDWLSATSFLRLK